MAAKSSAVAHNGFSTSTPLPAANAATTCGRWASGGELISTASTAAVEDFVIRCEDLPPAALAAEGLCAGLRAAVE